ncbi:hypothetical protein AC028_18620 [Xanthomonas citri pv. aurantifolii]|nr:hypothetical protein AC028_18620 [Xanthomonas citri pv. aurantifolii]ARE56985.1 hypothetical protein TP45_12040 [Xanthomonas citri pv. aurantifolii]
MDDVPAAILSVVAKHDIAARPGEARVGCTNRHVPAFADTIVKGQPEPQRHARAAISRVHCPTGRIDRGKRLAANVEIAHQGEHATDDASLAVTRQHREPVLAAQQPRIEWGVVNDAQPSLVIVPPGQFTETHQIGDVDIADVGRHDDIQRRSWIDPHASIPPLDRCTAHLTVALPQAVADASIVEAAWGGTPSPHASRQPGNTQPMEPTLTVKELVLDALHGAYADAHGPIDMETLLDDIEFDSLGLTAVVSRAEAEHGVEFLSSQILDMYQAMRVADLVETIEKAIAACRQASRR